MNVKPYTKKDFAWTQWTAGDIKKLVPKILEHKKQRYSEIKKILKDKRTFENTIYAIEASNYEINPLLYQIELLMNVSADKTTRETAKNTLDILRKKLIDIEYDEKLYQAVKEYTKKKEKLAGEDKKLLKDMVLGYRRMGFELSRVKRKIFQNNIKKLTSFSRQFQKNINDYHDHIVISPKETRGLPESYLARLTRDKKGNYLVTLQYPDLGPFMENAENAEKRRELADKNSQKGGEKNLVLASKILALRKKNAAILGYKNHAEYKIEDKMAQHPSRVYSFLNQLMPRLAPLIKKEVEELTNLKRKLTGKKNAVLMYYDLAYYANQLKKKKFSIDDEELRQYFPFWKVRQGIFKIYQNLLGVKFEQVHGYPLWHKDAELYVVKTPQGAVISYFLLDLYPREGKYTHACASEVVDGRLASFKDTSKYIPPVVCMIANFTKPVKAAPSLLSHAEVETFFHEFGHIMHYALTQASYGSQSGFHAAWDFVEAPSQMLENWTWEEQALKLLSLHYKTKKPLPPSIIKNLLQTKKFMIGNDSLRQLVLALFDMEIHTKGNVSSLTQTYRTLVNQWVGISPSPKSLFPASFGHFAGGYDAGYYGYMWSRVYAADMFTRFKKEGILNSRTGRDYRTWILEKGGSREEIDLVKGFLGRKPNNKAFLKEIGL
ncbi:MAG: M3 family metallopeptidase [bacterium]|nr:M3 family metallopeptidase [bacterium]